MSVYVSVFIYWGVHSVRHGGLEKLFLAGDLGLFARGDRFIRFVSRLGEVGRNFPCSPQAPAGKQV